ncbi:hypothetical protein EMIHUDRAFT_254123 [Emiliania huxleyi CCMP1516]|uniref:Uncharacterized protein n=2 Tax=Emiliania huxleyi TaxID=2903 RepID=A0A0D3JXF2_EMIH1|nr:hypothetical protein EMIHUDRAFT_254123 [Emiliania huxleyi CCMP1516]EOD28187.1 hypothetical protein EMIHUDRAFT_254123 [Emiliania huxleyi CCMP1516]|eukprot:XP_005780616.1 hypothetical protein EMIHUDRAFT_254123 [Emiliania huxleyi CCMP1516]
MPGRMRPTTLFVRKSHCKRTDATPIICAPICCLASPANSSLVISSAAARSNQCRVEMKLRDDARGLHAQGEAHELPHGKRLLGMRRLTPVGIPFLQASHFYRPRIWSTGRTFWYRASSADSSGYETDTPDEVQQEAVRRVCGALGMREQFEAAMAAGELLEMLESLPRGAVEASVRQMRGYNRTGEWPEPILTSPAPQRGRSPSPVDEWSDG